MRLSPVTIFICLFALASACGWDRIALAKEAPRAADEARRTQIEAARADALAALRQDVFEARIARDLTVGQFADRAAGGRDKVLAVVRDAEQIGGTRWLDEHTCEVRLDLAGGKVSRTLAQLAGDNPRATNLARPDLDRGLKRLDAQQFSASGVSTTSLESIRPPAGQPAWSGLNDEQVRKAVEAAHADAADRLLESVRSVPLGDVGTVGDALANAATRDELRGWLLSRPITSAEFREDREVRLAVYAPSDDFFDVLKSSLDRQGDARLRVPGDPAVQQQLRTQISRRMEPAIGRAVAGDVRGGAGAAAAAAMPPQARAMVPGAGQAVSLPRNVPNWIGDQLDAKGSAQGRWSDRMRTAGRAQADGLKRLRDRVADLPLTDQLKLGEAARRDPRIDRALDRALRRALAFKVDYGTDGTVNVLMGLNLQDLWAELEASQYGGR